MEDFTPYDKGYFYALYFKEELNNKYIIDSIEYKCWEEGFKDSIDDQIDYYF